MFKKTFAVLSVLYLMQLMAACSDDCGEEFPTNFRAEYTETLVTLKQIAADSTLMPVADSVQKERLLLALDFEYRALAQHSERKAKWITQLYACSPVPPSPLFADPLESLRLFYVDVATDNRVEITEQALIANTAGANYLGTEGILSEKRLNGEQIDVVLDNAVVLPEQIRFLTRLRLESGRVLESESAELKMID